MQQVMTQAAKTGDDCPLALSGAKLAKQLGISLRHLRRLDAAGKLPKPVRLGYSVRWLAAEIEAWLAAGAPDRKSWQQIRGAQR